MNFDHFTLGFSDFYIQDDFFEDPYAVREEILAIKDFVRGDTANYSGYAASLSDELRASVKQRVEQSIGHKIKQGTNRDMDMSARLSSRGDERLAKSFVHCDIHPFTAMIYLSPPECIPDGIEYGTRLYESREHGINTIMYERLKYRLRQKWTKEEFDNYIAECINNSFNLLYWKRTAHAEFNFNRLCIIEGQRFHSGSPVYYGESREQGRLSINFFFELDEGE